MVERWKAEKEKQKNNPLFGSETSRDGYSNNDGLETLQVPPINVMQVCFLQAYH